CRTAEPTVHVGHRVVVETGGEGGTGYLGFKEGSIVRFDPLPNQRAEKLDSVTRSPTEAQPSPASQCGDVSDRSRRKACGIRNKVSGARHIPSIHEQETKIDAGQPCERIIRVAHTETLETQLQLHGAAPTRVFESLADLFEFHASFGRL